MTAENIQDYFTKVPNAALEALAAVKLSGRELRIVLVVLRETCGFHRSTANLSGGYLAEKTGLEQRNCFTLVRRLCKRKILCKKNGEIGLGALVVENNHPSVVENDHNAVVAIDHHNKEKETGERNQIETHRDRNASLKYKGPQHIKAILPAIPLMNSASNVAGVPGNRNGTHLNPGQLFEGLQVFYNLLGKKIGVVVHWPWDSTTRRHCEEMATWAIPLTREEIVVAFKSLEKKYERDENQRLRMQDYRFSPAAELKDRILFLRNGVKRANGEGRDGAGCTPYNAFRRGMGQEEQGTGGMPQKSAHDFGLRPFVQSRTKTHGF